MDSCRVTVEGSAVVLADNCRIALTFLPRFLGLMMRRELPIGHGMLFPRCSSIHMLFMRFPIDAVYLDSSNRVAKIVENLRPWRVSAAAGADAILELPAGRAKECGLRKGDTLRIETL
jgi:uncharacterized membrane protein (UPF0127 family)